MAGSIAIRDLVVTRGTFTLHVDELEIKPREVFAILGRTGAGKTVLMEAIAGAFSFDSGSILLDGKDAASLPIQQRHMGVVYQDHALFPHMTVRNNIAYGLKMNGYPREEIDRRVNSQLALFGIEGIADKHPGIISGGESQRTALARALVLRPEILLLDEPFSALDPSTKERMYETVRDIHARFDCTIVFVTHDFNEAAMLADRVGVVLDGRLRCILPASELFDARCDPDVAAFLGRARAV